MDHETLGVGFALRKPRLLRSTLGKTQACLCGADGRRGKKPVGRRGLHLSTCPGDGLLRGGTHQLGMGEV